MNCEKCKYFENTFKVQVVGTNHPTHYEDGVYCRLSDEKELTEEDLQIKCPLEVENEC